MDDKYIVLRDRKHIYFIDSVKEQEITLRMERSNRVGFGGQTQLMYLSSYVINVKTSEMIKNRYPGQDWPGQIMEELFSGVSDATYI